VIATHPASARKDRMRKMQEMKKVRLINRIGKAFRGSSRGFTILEVVIAIALLGIIAVSVLTALSTASVALIIADRRATAESLARTQMEYVKHSPYDDVLEDGHPQYPLDPTITLPPSYNVVTTAVRLNQDENPNDDDGIQKITVTVSYDIVGSENKIVERQFTLEDYKRKLET